MPPGFQYVLYAVFFVIAVVFYIIIDASTHYYGMPKNIPSNRPMIKGPDTDINIDEYIRKGKIKIPRQLLDDLRSMNPAITDEDILYFWMKMDFKFLQEKYLLTPDEIVWLYLQCKGDERETERSERLKRLDNEFSLWNTLTFGFFKD
ncbi:hypothetical protein JXB22_08195 [candidate division WOR-3 bacterium]|nr:hypothetical protein [candidate division WOR-3 bacterium]